MSKRLLKVWLRCPYCQEKVDKEVEKSKEEVIFEKCPKCKKEPMVITRIIVLGEA